VLDNACQVPGHIDGVFAHADLLLNTRAPRCHSRQAAPFFSTPACGLVSDLKSSNRGLSEYAPWSSTASTNPSIPASETETERTSTLPAFRATKTWLALKGASISYWSMYLAKKPVTLGILTSREGAMQSWPFRSRPSVLCWQLLIYRDTILRGRNPKH